MCSGVTGRAALQQGLQGRGSLGVFLCLSRASSATDTSHGHRLWTQPGSTKQLCSGCRSWQPGAGMGTARLCRTPGELGQSPSTRSAVPLLSKTNHPRNNEPCLAHTALGQHETSLPDKGEKPERTCNQEVGNEGHSRKSSPATRAASAKGHQSGGMGSPRPAWKNAGIFPGAAEASTGDSHGDSVRMLAACRSSVSPERGRCWV